MESNLNRKSILRIVIAATVVTVLLVVGLVVLATVAWIGFTT